MPRDTNYDARSLLPTWFGREAKLGKMLPYISLVDEQTVRTRGNELFQCIRLDGVNSDTTDDAYLDRTRALFASVIARIGPECSFYVHKVSKAINVDLDPVEGDTFAAAVDRRWRQSLNDSQLRDKTLTLTVLNRPPVGSKLPFRAAKSVELLRSQTEKRLARLQEVVRFLMSSFGDMNPRLLDEPSGELLGFLGSLNTGQELPLYRSAATSIVSESVANTRVTF